MKNSKVIKTLTFIFVVIIISGISSKTVSAQYNIAGFWVKDNNILYASNDNMTISISKKVDRHSFCYGGYEPWDINRNKYSIRLHDKLDMEESGEFDVIVKKNKLKLKWHGGDYKYLKGTWKHKNWSYIPKEWTYNDI